MPELPPEATKLRHSPRRKGLGLPELIAVGVGGMIGGGIFSVLGLAVHVSGTAAPLAFLMGGVIAAIAGYSYVRLALAFRSDGASYVYLKKAFPARPWVSGIAGWTVVIGYVGTLALYSFTFGTYASHLFGLQDSHLIRILLSAASLLVFLAINLIGASAMGKAEDVAVYIKITLLTLLAGVGLFTADTERLQTWTDNGASSILLGGALIFVAFEGFELITNGVNETRDPVRNIPRGIYGSIAIVTAIYVLVAITAVGNLDVAAINAAQEYALATVAQPIFGKIGVVLVDIAAMLATISAINATIFGSSRVAYEMAHDDLAPRFFTRRTAGGVPTTSALTIVLLALVLSILGGLELIASFASLTFLLVSVGIGLANLRLREQTGTATAPVILGIVLMVITISLIVGYLALNTPGALYFALASYTSVAVAYLLYRFLTRNSRPSPG